jgi:phosphatidylglycerophosphate synthase
MMDDIRDALGPFWPGRLFEEPRSTDNPLYWVVLALFVAVFIAGLVMWLGRKRLAKGNRIHQHLFDLYGQWATGLGGAGILIVPLRMLGIPLFSKRLWTLLNLLAIVAVAAYFVRYYRTQYPQQMAEYREEERKRRFYPTPRRARPSHRTLHRAR